MTLDEQLLKEAIKHKGTDLGGLLQGAATFIKAIEHENFFLRADCLKMHSGLVALDKAAFNLTELSYKAMPFHDYAKDEKDRKDKEKKNAS